MTYTYNLHTNTHDYAHTQSYTPTNAIKFRLMTNVDLSNEYILIEKTNSCETIINEGDCMDVQ